MTRPHAGEQLRDSLGLPPREPLVDVDGPGIRKRREAAELSQTELAALVGITASYLQKIETGQRLRVRASIVRRIDLRLNGDAR